MTRAHHRFPRFARESQRGTTLIVVIVLLLLASVMTLFATRAGLFEQRASGNDLRAKLVQNVADAGLTQGAEHVLANQVALLETNAGWTKCTASDTSFPCGAVPAARRSSMYYYSGGATGAAPLDGAGFANRFLPFPNPVTTVNNGFTIVNGVGAVKCRLLPKAAGSGPAECTDDPNVNFYAVTLVSVAAMQGESARATVSKTFATHSTFGLTPANPPVMASGTVTLRGNIQVVASPNGAGPGVPVSVWTRRPLSAGGTPDTCYADEFFRSGTPTWEPASGPASDQILRCDDCDCSVGPITSGAGNACNGGLDILASPADCGPNQPVQASEFPCDLFQHVFGVQARRDTNGDNFCETIIMVPDPEYPDRSTTQQIGTDEAYLAEHADWIINGTVTTGFDARFVGDPRRITCDQITGKSGLIWVRNAQCGDDKVIGSPTAPVLLVHDGLGNNSPSFQNITLFGLMFLRSVGYDALDPATGGTVEFKLNSGSVVYGSLVAQGLFNKGNGHAAIVHNEKVLSNLVARLRNAQVYGLPGSWTDRVQY